MTAQEHEDGHKVITVRMAGSRADSVVVKTSWRRHYDARTLCETISRLIREALPPQSVPPEVMPDDPSRYPRGPIESARSEGFWNEFSLWLRSLELRREKAVEHPRPIWKSPETIVDHRGRAGVDFAPTGRFRMISALPEFLSHATAQQITDLFTELLRDVELVQEPPVDPDEIESIRHRNAFVRYHLN